MPKILCFYQRDIMPKIFYLSVAFLAMISLAMSRLAFAQDVAINELVKVAPTDDYNLTKLPDVPAPPSPAQKDSADELPSISSDELLNQPKLLEHALYSSIVLGNVEAVKKLLPLYQSLPNVNDKTGTLLITMSQALLAQSDGDNKTAIKKYREVLSEFPKMADVRFVLAKLLFDDRQFEASKDQFVRLRGDESVSDGQKALIERYLAQLDKVGGWQFGGGAGFAYDPNVGNAPSKRQIPLNGGVWTFSEPEKAYGVAYSLTASRDFNVKDNYYLKIDGGVNGKSYWSNHEHDDTNARLDVGAVYKNANTEWAVLPYHSARWLAGEPYSQESGVRGEYAHWLNANHQLLGAVEVGRERYDKTPALTGTVANGSLTWLFIHNARQYFSVGADYAYKDAKDKARAYDRYGVRASWTKEWQKGVSSQLGLDVGRRDYGAKDLFGIKRSETEYTGRLSLWHRKVHFWGITPRLTMTYRISDGNHPVYEYKKGNAFVQFNKTF